MHKLIGFTGAAASGKTTSAMMLKNIMDKEFPEKGDLAGITSFAAPLKRCLRDLFGFSHNQLHTLEGKETVDSRYGVTPRVIMQRFGTEFVRTTVPELWITLMREVINDYSYAGHPLYIDDVRFENEADLIRSNGGMVVHIQGRGGIDSDHESEKALRIVQQDVILFNAGILSDLKADLRELLT